MLTTNCASIATFFNPDKEVCSRMKVIRGGLVWIGLYLPLIVYTETKCAERSEGAVNAERPMLNPVFKSFMGFQNGI